MSYFLDTNTCIYALNGKFPAVGQRMARTSPDQIKVPSMVKAELLLGAEKSDRKQRTLEVLAAFMSPLEVVPFCTLAAEQYARIRANLESTGQSIGPNDLIIAATVLAQGGTLVTHNIREFSRVEGLRVEDWVGKASE